MSPPVLPKILVPETGGTEPVPAIKAAGRAFPIWGRLAFSRGAAPEDGGFLLSFWKQAGGEKEFFLPPCNEGENVA